MSEGAAGAHRSMKIADPGQTAVCDEVSLMLGELPLAGARLLELGCGKAEKTRALAASGGIREIVALEVDTIQHARNLQVTDLPNVRFLPGGAEAVPAPDGHFDIVVMFKSLHHVPIAQMDQALSEISRVLRPGGLAWISEPVYAGDFNEILRLFHDEESVRAAAFAAVGRAVADGRLVLRKQHFFSVRSQFDSFEEFDARMIQVTHTHHQLSPALYRQVRERFMARMTPEGARFLNPQRVDLLQKPV
jgi:SAM-dependent methyltransferase